MQGTVQHVGYIMKCHCAVCVVCRGLSSMWDTLWSVTVLYAGDCPTCGIRYEVSLCCVQGTVQHVGYVMKCDCIVCRGLLCLTCRPWWSRPTTCVPPEQSSWTTAAVSLSSPLHLRLTLFLPLALPHLAFLFTSLHCSPCIMYFTFILTSLHLYCSFSIISPFSWPHINFILTSHHLYLDLTLPFTWPHFTFYLTSLHLSLCLIFCSLEHDSSVCWASDPKARCITDMS